MDHVAIMNPRWKLLPKILSGEKRIESRWYVRKCDPWDNISGGDRVYFKDAGKPVSLVAEVEKVLQISDLSLERVTEILHEYGRLTGLGLEEIPRYIKEFGDKKYCLLIFLRNPQTIPPFDINKAGYGMGSAWLVVDDINKIRRENVHS
jgi:hypothetical protein